MVSHVLQLLMLAALSCNLQTTSASDPVYKTYFSFDSKNYRPGSATETNSCQDVRDVPRSLRSATNIKPNGLANVYQKYTEAYGIPVVSTLNVRDDALRRACYVLRFMLADNSVVREWVYRMSGRFAIIGQFEEVTDIPELSHYPKWVNQKTRAMGATYSAPISTANEENILCYQRDRYRTEDITVHSMAYAIQLLGAAVGIQGWDGRLRAAYAHAQKTGLFEDIENLRLYFAEGVQSYFNDALKDYDPDLYNLIKEIFPCDNTYLKRCESNRTQEDAQQLDMNCEPKGRKDSQIQDGKFRCRDKNPECEYWVGEGKCADDPITMEYKCKKSCGFCKVDDNCYDEDQKCELWAGLAECSINPNYMLAHCSLDRHFSQHPSRVHRILVGSTASKSGPKHPSRVHSILSGPQHPSRVHSILVGSTASKSGPQHPSRVHRILVGSTAS
ncbi:hypothetical protein RRG08_059687 [Elysia crispata]|uniref:ShKT domain-containing protein n=1 Tax=Elysia crispata TaxID=231223 RepID=A0AAE1B4D0_9GAST|nr:hypothetical protein RRG08_059687 [Elysia crispata]